jgi:hypothetical protein
MSIGLIKEQSCPATCVNPRANTLRDITAESGTSILKHFFLYVVFLLPDLPRNWVAGISSAFLFRSSASGKAQQSLKLEASKRPRSKSCLQKI